MKTVGGERRIGEALVRHRVADRTVVCGHDDAVLADVAAVAVGARIGWSLPQPAPTRGAEVSWPPERAVAAGWRTRLPGLVAAALEARRCDGVMVHHLLVTPELVAAVHRRGGFLHAWTVDAEETAVRVRDCGADGVVSNDPGRIRRALRLAALESS